MAVERWSRLADAKTTGKVLKGRKKTWCAEGGGEIKHTSAPFRPHSHLQITAEQSQSLYFHIIARLWDASTCQQRYLDARCGSSLHLGCFFFLFFLFANIQQGVHTHARTCTPSSVGVQSESSVTYHRYHTPTTAASILQFPRFHPSSLAFTATCSFLVKTALLCVL